MALGAWIVINEELSGQTHPDLLYLAGLFVAGPTLIAGLSLLLGRSEIPSIPGPSSDSEEEQSSS